MQIGSSLGKNPMSLIGIMISIFILTAVVTALFPTLVTQITSLSTLNNFTFATMFGDSSVMQLVLSALVLIGALAIVGVKVASGRKGR